MQSIIALAGLVSLATASIAPLYDNKTGTSTLAATFTTPLAWYTTEYITTSAFTTYCPEATTLTLGTRTLTVTSATTLTVTDCNSGCEIVRPLPTTTIEQTTEIVRTTALETYCPEPTTLTFSTRTYTVTKAMTLTIPHTVTAVSTITAVIPVQPTKTNSTCVKPSKYSTPAPEAPTTPVIPVIPVIPVTPVTPAPTTPAPTTPIVPTVTPVPTDDEDEDLQVIEPFIPSTETLSAVITTAPLSTLVLKPTGDNATFTTKPTLYTGAANRMGAGALVAAAGFAVLF